MADDLDIRGGGAIAVDTDTHLDAADRIRMLTDELAEICVLVGSAGSLLFSATPRAWEVSYAVETLRRRALAATDEARQMATDLREAAAVYEVIELRAERAARLGDPDEVACIDARLTGIARHFPDAAARADRDSFDHWLRWPNELARQAPGSFWWLGPGLTGSAGLSAWGIMRTISAADRGSIAPTARLTGSSPAVTVTPVIGAPTPAAPTAAAPTAAAPTPGAPTAAAPATLAAAAGRIPGGGDARIRVERYTMADGSRQFAVYVAGTQTVLPGSGDPFDMQSNAELYAGERSASYEATLAALEQSGAEPGDVVHAFGHSQGAMITAHLALEGGYDTQTLVSFGSPVEADVGADTLSVTLRHRDDPIGALAGGGHPSAVGAPGSFIAERTADPAPGLHDWQLPAHGIDGYTRTAEMLDASQDPRMGAVRSVFDELGGAASVDVIEYSAQRG